MEDPSVILRPHITICLFDHWNINNPLQFKDHTLVNFDLKAYSVDDWEASLLEENLFYDIEWPNAIRDVKEAVNVQP